jgi:hypothetical protein
MNEEVFADVVFDNGKVNWTHKQGDKYMWIGRLVNGSMFRSVYTHVGTALGINAWNARLWLVREGKRKLLKTVVN